MNKIQEIIKITDGLTELAHDHFVNSGKDNLSVEGQIFYTSCAVLERLKALQILCEIQSSEKKEP